MAANQIGIGDFIVFLILTVVTLGIYPMWWSYTRIERIYRKTLNDDMK